jgi:hypothetical protein
VVQQQKQMITVMGAGATGIKTCKPLGSGRSD